MRAWRKSERVPCRVSLEGCAYPSLTYYTEDYSHRPARYSNSSAGIPADRKHRMSYQGSLASELSKEKSLPSLPYWSENTVK
eukprot:1195101-Prorocentrum_minimum.AAC.12